MAHDIVVGQPCALFVAQFVDGRPEEVHGFRQDAASGFICRTKEIPGMGYVQGYNTTHPLTVLQNHPTVGTVSGGARARERSGCRGVYSNSLGVFSQTSMQSVWSMLGAFLPTSDPRCLRGPIDPRSLACARTAHPTSRSGAMRMRFRGSHFWSAGSHRGRSTPGPSSTSSGWLRRWPSSNGRIGGLCCHTSWPLLGVSVSNLLTILCASCSCIHNPSQEPVRSKTSTLAPVHLLIHAPGNAHAHALKF